MSRRLAFVVLLVAVLPRPAAAQVTTSPFSGLFGKTPERVGKEFTAVQFRSSLGGQFDDGLIYDETATDRLKGGYAGTGTASLAFARRTSRSQFLVRGGANYQENLTPRAYGATGLEVDGHAAASLTDRVSIDSTWFFTHSPFFQLLPAFLVGTTEWDQPPTMVANPFAARLLMNDSADGQIMITDRYTKRSSISVGVLKRAVQFPQSPDANFDMNGVEGKWRRQMTRDVGIHFNYRREDYRFRSGPTPRILYEYLDAGVDVSRLFSVTRRTTFGFSTQTGMTDEGDGRRFRLDGTVGLTKLFERTWRASLEAQRRTEVVPGLTQPLFSDMLRFTIDGMLGSRLQWQADAGGGRGRLGHDDDLNPFNIATATTRLDFAITRRLGTYVQYAFYQYNLPTTVDSVLLWTNYQRNTVIVGLDLWVPIYEQVRAPRGPQ